MNINKNLLNNNKDFYPTPDKLICKMLSTIKTPYHDIKFILEPSAGKGNIVNYIKNKCDLKNYAIQISVIEKDDYLRNELKLNAGNEKGYYRIIDSDFLAYSGNDKFDLIIMNPPFSEGEYHLQKAIDIMFNGEIICLLNAETLRNPYTNHRMALIKQLQDLKADIEYISNAFIDAERSTSIDVALIHIMIKNDYESLLTECNEKSSSIKVDISLANETTEINQSNKIEALVQEYDNKVHIGMETLKNYFKNYSKINKYMRLQIVESTHDKYRLLNHDDFNREVNERINDFLKEIRKDYWHKVLDLPDVYNRMTKDRIDQFNADIQIQSDMEFTVNNIRTFILNLIKSYEDILIEAVAKLFEEFSRKYTFYEDETCKNTWLYNGWKTNKAYKINEKIILPIRSNYGHPFIDWGKWRLHYSVESYLNDIDIVCSYFKYIPNYISIKQVLTEAFTLGKTRNINSTYFKISVYKKGTMHLEWRDLDILRRFNITACKEKGFLYQDYGKKKYNDMTSEEKNVVDSFEGEKNYTDKIGQIGFSRNNSLKYLENFIEK